MFYKIAEGKTERWKRFWAAERAISEAVLYKPAQWVSYIALTSILFILAMNWLVVGQRLTKWQGFMSGAAYEITGFLMGVASIIGIAVTWYAGAHIRITFFREKCGPRARAGLDAFGALMFLGWTTAMAFGTWWAATDAVFRGKCSMVFCIPEAPFRFIFFVAAAHFILVLIRSFIGATSRALRADESEDDSEEWKRGRIPW